MDSPEFTDLSTDLKAGEKFRQATIERVKKYLGEDRPRDSLRAEDVNLAIASFNPVGEEAAFRMTAGQRKLFMDEVIRYIDACGEEQRSELSGHAPTIGQYLPVRLGTSAGSAIAAGIE